MTVQAANRPGLEKLGPVVERLALAEGLAAHQRAVRVRLDNSGRAERPAPPRRIGPVRPTILP
jgi:histidinol dehydrogenase